MAKNDPAHIVAGAGLLTGIFTKLNQYVVEFGGSAEDIHRLSKPEGEAILRRMAELVVPSRVPDSLLRRLPLENVHELGVHSYNLLKRAGINTMGALVSKTEPELTSIPGMQLKYLEEIQNVVAGYRLRLKSE